MHSATNKHMIKQLAPLLSLLFGFALCSNGFAQTQPAAQPPAATTDAAAPAAQEAPPPIPADQLDSLVAPIALYPDPLLVQTLAASTYPLEIIQMQQWVTKNPTLKDKALADAVAKQPWDASVQSLAAFPDVLKQLGDNVAWTTDLGNAFLDQQADVMAAVQRMRAKAQGAGNLKASAQQSVQTETVGGQQVIVIESADPETVYVPQYNPSVVYGAPLPYAYPYTSPPGYGLLAFGTGIAMGAAWGGNWGSCDWNNGGDININNNNNFNKNTNVNGGNRNNVNGGRGGQGGGGGKWNHNPSHRGGAPYGSNKAANQYGGRSRSQPAAGAGTLLVEQAQAIMAVPVAQIAQAARGTSERIIGPAAERERGRELELGTGRAAARVLAVGRIGRAAVLVRVPAARDRAHSPRVDREWRRRR